MQRYDGRFAASPRSVRIIRSEVHAIARECGLEGRDLDDVALAVSEAATNAVIHGARGDEPTVTLAVRLEHGELLVTVGDDGDGIAPRCDSSGAGLGLPVIATVAKRLEIDSGDDGTRVHMAFPCPNAVAA